MCGIAGWIDFENNLTGQEEILALMTRSLTPRGPNAEGFWVSPHALLGHRRLVVVDPEGGAQPMSREFGGRSCTIVYNGELYNTLEIRRDLEQQGHQFITRNSDTEVLLHAYLQWGENCVNRFNGIFAFAIWDHERQTLFMSRDRLGVKPLFYSWRGKRLFFASELKALLLHPDIKAVVDGEGLAEIFSLGPSRTPGSGVFKGISELRPGFSMMVDCNGPQIKRYWSLISLPHQEDLDTTSHHLLELFKDTVERQLVADVPVCTFLSGGLDSSAITAIAAQSFKEQGLPVLQTFSVDYIDDANYYSPNDFETSSDAPWARKVADYLGTNHRAIYINNIELAEALNQSLDARDLPGMTDVDSSLYLFCREIAKYATVAVSGECADEILGGYPWFRHPTVESFPWITALDVRTSFLSPLLREKLDLVGYSQERYRQALAEVPYLEGETSLQARMRELFYLNIIYFMTTLLDRKDRMSMAWGLEVRVPFADHRLVEYIWNIPWEMKNLGGMSKGIMRRSLQGLLPEDVLYRRKSPYPKTHHPHYAMAVRSELVKVLEDPASPLLELIDREMIVNTLAAGKPILQKPWFGQLMRDEQYMAYLLQVNRWLDKFKVQICL